MPVVRIAHLSDLHLSAEYRRSHIRRTRRLLDHVLSAGFDHVVITGDLTANADPRDYELARIILASSGLLDPAKLTVVPGNHDVFGGVHQAEDLLVFPGRCRKVDVEGKLGCFRRTFHELFEGCTTVGGGQEYPFAKLVGGVALVGLNTVMPWSRVGNPFGSNGRVGEGQRKRLRELLALPLLAGRRKLGLLHHHFLKLPSGPAASMHGVWSAVERQTLKLRGKRELVRILREGGVDLVLHGHVHEVGIYTRDGMRFANAGGSVIGADPDALAYHEVTVDAGRVEVETHWLDGLVRPVRRPVPMAVQSAA